MKFGYLEWRDEALILVNESQQIKLNIGKVVFDDIKYIKLGVDESWQLALLKENKTKCEFWFSKDGQKWSLYPEDSENNRINLDEDWYFLYPHLNSIALLKRAKKIFNIYFEDQWHRFSLPEGVRWIDIEPDRGFLAVGSKPASRVKKLSEEVACWRKEPDNLAWKEKPIIMSSWWNAYQTIQMGGFGQLQEADTRMEPYVFASECSWFLDDRSWFIFLKLPNGKFYAYRLQELMIDVIRRDPNGFPVILASNHAKNLMLSWSGKKWIPHDLTKTIRKFLGKKGYLACFSLKLSFAYHNNHLLAVGKMLANEQAFINNIVLYSEDSGLNWEVIRIEKEKGCVLLCPYITA